MEWIKKTSKIKFYLTFTNTERKHWIKLYDSQFK